VTRCVCEKIALCKCSPTIFCQNYYRTFKSPKFGILFNLPKNYPKLATTQ
jgi:hypothetical protein